ncbi:hypothetical protein [Deinococcus ruber]|uniref:Uncharacterized protein n=1 Tax=Deinococcus ruber TaxID=1848197 RepID=A0A918C4X7_9DEIO|nr:hypothetical protein [Deinococcus ruber]GGR05994.1 hypothetical protein GCM10008957_18440 [Deinococcus ruber]
MSQPALAQEQRFVRDTGVQRVEILTVHTAPLPVRPDPLSDNMDELSLVAKMQERYSLHLGLE